MDLKNIDVDDESGDDNEFVDDRAFYIHPKRHNRCNNKPVKNDIENNFEEMNNFYLLVNEKPNIVEGKKIMEEKKRKYKSIVEIAITEMEKELKQNEKNPKKHPKYSEEWKLFWIRRYKQLILEGKNANDHDYEPEWVEYWKKRMKELHDKEVEKIKVDEAKKIGLTPESVKNVPSYFENLTDDEFKYLLRNFMDLTNNEKSHLIAFLNPLL